MRQPPRPAAALRRHLALGLAAAAAVSFGTAAADASGRPAAAAGPARAQSPGGRAGGGEVTGDQDALRTGWDPAEPGLAPKVLRSGRFGRVFSTRVHGQVYAQPLVVGQMVIAATEQDWVYGIDAVTGRVHWSVRLGHPGQAPGCPDLQPRIGITGTPVYDPQTGMVNVVAETTRPGGRQAAYYLFAVNPRSGHVTRRVAIGGHPVNDPRLSFSAVKQLQRPALLLLGPWVLAAFGSHCDQPPYAGYVAAINPSTGRSRLWSDESGLTSAQGGIWQSGGGLMSDGPGRAFFTSGNGISPAPGPGTRPPGQLGDAVVRLAVGRYGALSAQDFFSPRDAPALAAADIDFGSGGPAGLPFGTRGLPHLLVQAGKDGRVFLLNTDHLGGREQGPGGGDAAVSQAGPFGGQWGHPAVFGDTRVVTLGNSGASRDYVYYLGRDDYLRYLKFRLGQAGRPALTDVGNSSFTFGYTSGSPVVTSTGTRTGSAVVWAERVAGPHGSGASLNAFPAVPGSHCRRPCTMRPLWSGPIGRAAAFASPATAGGRVYVGTGDGYLLAFGLRSRAALGPAAQVSFPATAVGGHAGRDVTVTASARVTVDAVTASATGPGTFGVARIVAAGPGRPGGAAGQPVRFPVTLRRGDVLRAAVEFAPAAPGGLTGTLALRVADPQAAGLGGPDLDVPLSGEGIRAGLFARPGRLDFGLTDTPEASVPVGTGLPVNVVVSNGGPAAETVTGVTGPAAPFSAAGLPRPGTRLQPGQAIVIQVTYRPRAAGPAAGQITIAGSAGPAAVISLHGTGRPPVSRLSPSAATVNFGRVQPGHQATAYVTISNTGNLPATVAGTSRLAVPFRNVFSVYRGLPVVPGTSLTLQLTFRPPRRGTFTGTYQLTWTDALGRHTSTLRLTGTGG